MARDYFDESKPTQKKKKEEKKTVAKTTPQSSVSNVTKKSTFLGGGASVQKTEERSSTASSTPSSSSSTSSAERERRLTQNTTAAQRQKMGMPTSKDLREAKESRRQLRTSITNAAKDALSDDNRGFMQRQKSGTQTEADKRRTEKMVERRTEIARNTGAVAKKSLQDSATGYAKTLYDVTELTAGNRNGTQAMAMKMGIQDNKQRMRELEEQRRKTVEESRNRRLKLGEAQDKRQAEWDERTKNAKGLEKAWYGAVESGTGMLADTAIGAATGTGQFGALASMGLRTYGTTRGQAEKEGATEAEDRLYSLAQAGKEVGTELMFQGAGLAKKAYGGAGLSLADKAANVLTRGLAGRKADIVGAGVRLLGGTAEENAEEIAGWGLDPIIKEVAYGRKVRERAKESLLAGLPEIGSAADADRVASYFSTNKFTDDLMKEYRSSGLSEKEAKDLADEMRDMYVAYYANDQATVDRLSEDIAAKISGQSKLGKDSWSLEELGDTLASTTLLTMATGAPGAVTTSVRGNAIFDSDEIKERFGENAVRKIADAVQNVSDEEMSIKAKSMLDRLDSGKDLTGTQKYDLYQGYMGKLQETAKKARASEGMTRRAMEEQNLVPTKGIDAEGNRVYAQETQRAYNEKYASAELTTEAFKDYMESDNSISDDEARRTDAVKKAVADLHVGGLTVGDAHEFAYGNTLAREVLLSEEGIDLNDYVVRNKDGSVNYAATNEATENALFTINADNAIRSAQTETAAFIDNARGEIDTDIMSRMGNSGQAVWKSVNKDLDPRNLSEYLTAANATSYFYSAGRNTDVDMNTFVAENGNIGAFRNVPDNVLKRAFAAGARDRIIANTPMYGQTVEAGSNIKMKKTKPVITGQLIVDKDVALPDSAQSAYLALAMSTNTNVHIVGSLKSSTGAEVNGMSKGNDIYLNVNAAAEQNVGYVLMHEMTHQIKQYAPNEYMALENLVRDRWFNKDAAGMQKAIKDRIDLYAKKGNQSLTEEEAMEEIIADAMAEAIDDPNFAAQVCDEDINLGQAILNSIKDALRSIRAFFASEGYQNDAFHRGLLSYLDILDQAEKMWINALHTARQNKADGLIADWQDRANKQNAPRLSVGEGNYSITTDKEDFIKGANLSKDLRDWAKEMGLEKLSSQPVKGPVIVSVRDLRSAWYEKNGRADEAEVINKALDKIGDSLTQLVGEYQYIDLGDALNAAVTYRTDAEGHPTSVILSCQVKNAEYEVNFDFTTICAKRLAMQKILEKFIKTEGERQGTTLYDELKLDEEGLYKLRLILETAGFEVSCRGCFVEQNRYSQQNQARTIANDWNAALDEWAKDNGTEVTENFGLTTLDIDSLDYEEIEAGFERYHELMKGKKTDVATKNRMLIEASPFFRKRMNASDYASMAGQRALMAIGESKKGGTNLYGLLKRGQSDSKQSVPFTAYNGEISLLPDNMKGKSLYDYLLSIGGARAQSASDFQIEFVYDYMQMVADLSARGLPMHMYTKVIELAELFGMTGIKINLSAMCDVAEDVGGEYAGLKIVDGKYEYNISDQSIDYEKAVELQKREGYSKNIGIIMVTLSSQHMLKSLDDPDVRYIIGYHSSAMPVVVANMSNMGGATDYTKINKTNKLNEKGQALFDEAMEEAKGNTELEKYKDALRIFDEKIQEETAKKKKRPRRGNEYGAYMSAYGNNTADFNTYDSLLETKDARKTADKYLEHCMENGLIPIYFPFAFHENYYKCEVYDFNMYDNNTGEYAPMGSVQNIYPGLNMAAGETDTTAFTERVSEMMDERNRLNESLDSQYDAVFDEAKNTLKYSITGDDYMDFDASGIDHNELTHRADAPMTAEQQRDADYMDAVNSGNMDEAQRLVDEAAKAAGMKVAHRYHGTMNAGFTVFDKAYAKVGGNSGAGFYFSTEKDDSVNHYADVEGADNYFKWSSLAEHINDQINEGTWEGPELETYEDVEEYAKEQLNKNPGTYDVYLNYKSPYVRNGRSSTNIYNLLYDDFDESIIDKDDYDTEDEYEEALYDERSDEIYRQIATAVHDAMIDVRDFYEVIDSPTEYDIYNAIADHAFSYEEITWDSILRAVESSGYPELIRDDWTDSGYGATEITRAIIENFGYDAIEDKEVSSKFGQLSREMMTDTDHIIVFKPEQIKLSDPVTYAEDGSVIPLSERFDPNNNDIRYSLPTTDSDGNILTDGQMDYFKNSQARDAEGKLVPVYHSTYEGGFTIFDPSYAADHRSLFFTNSRIMSESYISDAETGDINPYEENKKYRFITNVGELPDNFDPQNIFGIEIFGVYEGDNFLEAAAALARYAESEGFDLADELIDANEIYNEGPKAVNEAWGLFNAAWEFDIDYQMAYEDPLGADDEMAGTYTCYLNLENPMVIDCNGAKWHSINFDGETHDTREWAEIAASDGHDGVIFRDVIDYGHSGYGSKPADVYVAFSSNQVKDVRNENPTENPDIRYSFTPEDEAKSQIAYNDAMDDSYELLAYYEQQLGNVNPETFDVSKAFREEDVVKFLDSLKAEDTVPSDDAKFEEDRARRAKSKEDFFNNVYAKWNDRWTTEGEVLKISSVKRDITNLVKGAMANSNSDAQYRNDVVRKTLLDARLAYQLMQQDRTELASYLLYHSAQRMMDGLEFIRDDTAFKEYQGIRDFMRQYRIEVPDKYWEDPTFLDFRKEYFGRLRIAKGGTHGNIEDIYKELSDNWPHLFSESQREKNGLKEQDDDLLYHIGEVIDSNVTPFMEAYSSEEATSLAYDLADQLYEIIANGDRVVSLADSYKERFDAKTKAMKQRHEEALIRIQNERDNERQRFQAYKEKQSRKLKRQKAKADFEIATLKQNREYNIQRLKAEKARAVKEERQKSKWKAEERRDRMLHNKYFKSIQKTHKKLADRLLANTKDSHIPEQYKRELARLLSVFDLQTMASKDREVHTGPDGYTRVDVAQSTLKMAALKATLEQIESNSEMFRLNDAITDIMDDLIKNVDGKTIDILSSSDLKNLDSLMKALLHEFNNYEKVRVGIKKQQAADIGHAQNDISLEHAKMYGAGKDYQNTPGWIDKILNLDEITPAYLFKRIDPNKEGLGLMYGEIRKSFDKYVRNQNQLNEWMEEIVGKYHNKGILWNKYGSGELTNWRSDIYAKTFELENGTIRLTIAQMMSLSCLANRKQAYDHMVGNGVVVAPVTFNAKILSDVKGKASKALPVRLTDADIKTIVAQLTPEQKQVANKLQELMATKMAEWGNEASMNVIGIRLFEDPDYFPIRSDRGGLTKDLDPNQFEQAIRNFGFTKAVQPGAKNAIMIDDIFDVVTEHCNNMNLYNSYTEAMNDFMKVYNYREAREEGEYTVEQALKHAYSDKTATFIMQFMRDLNGNVSKRASGIEDAYNSLLGNAKKSAVFANLRVAAQQPTAITRAFAVIHPKYLKGIKIGQGEMTEMFEHCPIALWKSWGYYDINMGKSIEDIMMNNGRWLEDKATDLYGALDNVTWTAIWQMVKAETKDTHPELKEGSDEFFEHCNERMSEIVDLTQVVDSPMHRSHAMRNKNFLVKTATAFMAEPTLTYNMIRDGWISAREAWKSGDKAKAEKIKWRTVAVALLQAATVGGMAAIVDALRKKKPDKDDDDDRFLHLWWVNALEDFKGELEFWNKIYFVKDIASIFEGWDNANLALQGIQKFALGCRQFTGDPYARSSASWYENMADGIGYMWGVPVKTMRTGLANAMDAVGLQSPILEATAERLDSMAKDPKSDSAKASGFMGSLLSDDANGKGMFGKLLTTKSDNADSETTSEESSGSDVPTRESLPDNLTDEQKDEIIKSAERRAKTAAPAEEEKRDYDTMLYDAMKASTGYEGEKKDKKIWESVSKGYKAYVEEGNYERINMMRRVVEEAGGDLDYFDKQVNEASKSALKKSIKSVSDMTEEEFYAQRSILGHLRQSGMSDEQIGEYVYKSETRTNLQVAMRLNDEDAIFEELTALVNAGFTQADFEKAYKNRNRVDLKNYREKNGKYADRLKSMGNFIWPTEGVITSHFGYRNAPTAGASSNHPAIDIGAPQGTAVVAADGGVVISAGANGGYGNSVGIKHDNGMITWYNHLYDWNVKEGDTVAQGQQIAQVGSTGISTGPHLDFKIMDKDGNPVDPEKYLDAK